MTIEDESTLVESDLVDDVRSWGKWSLSWAFANMIFSCLSSPSGLLLLVVGLASFYYSASMFIVFGVIDLWAAVSNLIVGETLAYVFSIVLIISAVQAFRSYFRYRPVETMILTGVGQDKTEESHRNGAIKSSKIIPWCALSIALASLSGVFLAFIISMVWLVMTGSVEPPRILTLFGALSIQFGILADSLGLASILSTDRYKTVSVLGMLGGAVAIILDIIISVTG